MILDIYVDCHFSNLLSRVISWDSLSSLCFFKNALSVVGGLSPNFFQNNPV